MSGRVLEDWLNAYVQYAKNSEPPLIFHPWIGISMLAGALGRKVHTSLGFETLYPNLYIILLAPSGCRKSTAINIGRQIITPIAGVKIGAQATTREMLIKDMAESMVTAFDEEDTPFFHSSFTQIASELHVFLRRANVELLADMCSWYDCESPWENRTKTSGIDTINGICLNLIDIPSMMTLNCCRIFSHYSSKFAITITLVFKLISQALSIICTLTPFISFLANT